MTRRTNHLPDVPDRPSPECGENGVVIGFFLPGVVIIGSSKKEKEDWIGLDRIGLESDLQRSKLLCGPSSRSTVGSTALLRKRHSRPHRRLLDAHAAELHDGEEEQKQTTTEKERNPSKRRRDTKSKAADPFQDMQSPRRAREARELLHCANLRSTSLADATLDASLPSSKAPSAHRSMSPAGRMTYGGSRITPATHARRRKPAESHPQGPAAGSHQQ